MSYAGVVARKGAAVSFSYANPGIYNPTNDTTTDVPPTVVTGHAMEIGGDPELYQSLALIEMENPTLLFNPDTVGQLPALGSTIAWGGETFTVKNISRLAMNGVPTAARIVVGG